MRYGDVDWLYMAQDSTSYENEPSDITKAGQLLYYVYVSNY